MLETINALTFTEETERGGKVYCHEYQLKFKKLLCSQEKTPDGYLFAVGTLEDGRVAVAWETHSRTFDTMEDMLAAEPAVLNSREKLLLEFGAHK